MMAIGLTDLFWQVVRTASELPEPARSAVAVSRCNESRFDETYIAFLDKQIELSPRGPEWTERLRRRRAGLAPYCGVPLVSGHVRVGTSGFTIYVDPATRRVVYWEEYEGEFRAVGAGPPIAREG